MMQYDRKRKQVPTTWFIKSHRMQQQSKMKFFQCYLSITFPYVQRQPSNSESRFKKSNDLIKVPQFKNRLSKYGTGKRKNAGDNQRSYGGRCFIV